MGLLVGCIQDEWFRPVNRVAVQLLEMAGYTVAVPERQTCCGALAAHDGKADAAVQMQDRNTDAFGGFDLMVATVAGCSAHLHDYRWPGHRPETLDITVAVARAIASGHLPSLTVDNGPIAIQDPCHLRHAQRVVAEPTGDPGRRRIPGRRDRPGGDVLWRRRHVHSPPPRGVDPPRQSEGRSGPGHRGDQGGQRQSRL